MKDGDLVPFPYALIPSYPGTAVEEAFLSPMCVFSIFVTNNVLCMKDPKISIRKPLELINTFSKVAVQNQHTKISIFSRYCKIMC